MSTKTNQSSRDPYFVFDFYFSDAPNEDSARYNALNNHPHETQKLFDLLNAESIISFALWNELPKNHPTGELWLETETDIHGSIYLAYGGYFRQALAILRSWLEISMHGIFFGEYYGQPSGRYEQWRRGQRNAPAKIEELCRSFAKRTDRAGEIDENTMFQRLDPLYKSLSAHVHSKGIDVYKLQAGRDNVPRYLKKSFMIWYQNTMDIFGAICFLYDEFYRKELGKYFAKSPSELRRARTHANALVAKVPDLARYVENAVKEAKTSSRKKKRSRKKKLNLRRSRSKK